MTITYPLTAPTVPAATQAVMTQENQVAVSESPTTFEQQVYEHPGKRWKVAITLPPMRRLQAAPWQAFFAKLNGRKGTFLYWDPDAINPQGVASGTPLVNGGSQTGAALNTKGWTNGITGILKAGDYFQLGSGGTARLYMVLDDTNSNGSGLATLANIWPPLRSSPNDSDPLTLVRAMTQFRLDAPFEWDADRVSTYGIKFSATEAL